MNIVIEPCKGRNRGSVNSQCLSRCQFLANLQQKVFRAPATVAAVGTRRQ